MTRSLGGILALALAGLQFVAVTIVVSWSYFASEKTFLAHARTLLYDVSINAIEHTKGFLTPARSAAELSTRLAESRIVREEDADLLEKLLFQQLQSAPQFAGAYYGDTDGNFVYVQRSGLDQFTTKIIDVTRAVPVELLIRDPEFTLQSSKEDPSDTYDPRNRPWFQSADSARDSIWTDPYIFFTSRSPGITAASPVIEDGSRLQGVVGVDIEISALSDFLADLRIGANGAALVVNGNGDVIAHPDQSLLAMSDEKGGFRFPTVDEIDDPLARAALSDLSASGSVKIAGPMETSFRHDGAKYISLAMPFDVEGINWTILVYAPEDDFIGPIRTNQLRNILIAVLVAAATGLLGLALANKIHKPVRAFAVRSALISQGELDPDEPLPRTYRELEHANEALMDQISQRKQTEEEYQMTFDLASRGMAQIEPETGRILKVNDRLAEIFGCSATALEGASLFDFIDTSDRDFARGLRSAVRAEEAFGLEGPVLRSGTDPIWISLNGVFIRDGSGATRYIVATVDDISSSREAEEKIETLNREVALFSRHNMLGELATGLAHELNQPLTAITQNTDAALLEIQSGTDRGTEVKQILEEIDRQSYQAADIIKALRGLVRKDDGVAALFSLNDLLRQSRQLVLSEARAQNIEINIADEPLVTVQGVRVQVAQVVVNLLRNAIEAIAEAKSPERRIDVSMSLDGPFVVISVEDTGPGVSPDITLFTKFETSKAKGMGLGLSLSRSLVQANGGKLWYDTAATRSRFCFSLKRATETT